MKKTSMTICKLTVLLLCLTFALGLFVVGASAANVSEVKVGNVTLSGQNLYVVDTGAGYEARTYETLEDKNVWVAQFIPSSGKLTLQNYNGGPIYTNATGDLTISLIGDNTITSTQGKPCGIKLVGGRLTITSENAASLTIRNTLATSDTDEADHYMGISNGFAGEYTESEGLGYGVTITGKADVSIVSTKKYKDGTAFGIGTAFDVYVAGNASLSIEATNEFSNAAVGIGSLDDGMHVINTTGDVSISVCGKDENSEGEALFQGASTTLGEVGRMELNWTFENINPEDMIQYSDVLLADDGYVIGQIGDDVTSKTYGFKYPITVTDGVAKVDGVEVDSAAKGQTVTLIANTPEANEIFASWNNITEGGSSVTLADPSSPTTTFTMLAEKVDWDAAYQPLYTITVNKGTATPSQAVSGTLIYLVAAEPDPGYVFKEWTSPDGVTFSDASSPTTNFILGDGSVTVTATYTPIDYMILVTDGTAKIGDTTVTEANVEQEVTLTANDPAIGYVFKEWSITSGSGNLADATSATTTLTGITSEIQIEALYEKETFTVTTTYATATKDGNPVTSAQIDDVFTITAEDRPGMTFNNGWDTSGGTVTSNAATTTFIADGTGNISIEPVYSYKDYTVTITGGLGSVDGTADQITDAHVGDTVSISADDPATGKAFIRWEIRAGNVTLADPTNYITSFTMIAGNVEIEPIYADIVKLDRLDFTMTTPTVGEHPSFTLVSAEPTKYGYDSGSLRIYLNESPYPELTGADVYLIGKSYGVEFKPTLANGYELADGAKVYLNGIEMNRNLPWWQCDFEFPVPITVTGGKAYSNSERTEQITSGRYKYVYLKADPAPEGKQFMGWVVRSGDITISNADYEEASFYLKDESVTVEAVFATVLDEVVLTVTKPKVGDLATIEITSADPEKYTAVLNAFSLGKSPYTTLLPTDTFEHGNPYDMRFEIIAADGYTITYDTVITLNGEETSCYGGAEQQEWSFRLPVLVTVTGGKAYTTSSYESEIGEVYPGNYVYLKAGDAPEGKKFLAWKITDDSSTYYYHYDTSCYINYSITTLTCEVIWAIPIDTVVGTMSPITVGQTPITTVTDSSDLYDIVIDRWYYYDEERNMHEMLPADTYQPNVEYRCEFSIVPIDGYFIDRENVEITINDKQLSAFGYSSGTGIVYARAYYLDTVYVNFDITGGKLYLDGVETNETKFLPGTMLTLVADESLFPEGQVFKEWDTPYIYSTIVGVTDYRFPTLTFTVGVPSQFDSTIVIEAQYQTLTLINYGPYTNVPHPTIGGTPSYNTEVPSYQNYYGEVLGWYEGETLLDPSHVFEEGKVYTVKIRLTPAAGYYFHDAEYYDTWEPSNSFNGTDVDGILLECGENGAYLVFTASIQARHYEDSASVTVTAPVAGMAPDKTVTKSADTYCDVGFSRWEIYDEEAETYRKMLDGELFEVGKTYRIYVTFTTNETHYIDLQDLVVLINGTEPTYYMGGTAAGGYSTCGYYLQFTVEAGEPYDVVVDGGTASVDASPVTEVGGGVTVTLTANEPDPGKAFKGWEIVSGENVFLVDATASTTTFVMPAGDVSIKAVYRNTPHDVTVEGGEADITFAGSGETITVTAGDAPDGKYFAGWECIAGGVTFADATQKTTTFVMTAEAVEVRVIWADKIYLEELTLTVTKPANGNSPSEEITSADPTKYTATFDYWWDNFNNREMGAEDVFSYGVKYGLVFDLELDEKYYIDSSTVVTVNGETSGYYFSNPPYLHRYADLHVPVPVTVEGGVATNSSDVTITEQKYGNSVYLTLGEIPEGKSFLRWEVVSGGVSINSAHNPDSAYFYMYTKEPVVIRAVFQDVLYNVTVTDGTASHTTAVAGTTVTLTAGTAPADHVFDKWVIVSGTVTFANANDAETTFTMPAGAVSVKATYKEVEKILLTEVNVTLDVPVLGEKPDFTATLPNDAHYSVSITWETSANGTEMTADSVFENGFFYEVCITVIPSAGYKVDSTTVVKLNGTEIDGSGNTRYYSFTFWKTVDGPAIPEDAVEITDQNSTPYSYEGNTATYDAVNGWTSVIDVDGYYSAVNLVLKAGDVVYYQFLSEPSSDVYLYDFTSDNCTNHCVYGDEAISSLTGALTAPADATYAFEYWASSSIPVKLYVVRAAAGGVTVPSGAEEITDQNASAATKDENTATYEATNGWTGIDTGSYYDLFTLDLKAGDTLYYSINGSTSVVQLRDRNGIAHYCGSGDTMPDVGQLVVQIDGTYTFGIDDDGSTTAGTTVKVYVVRASGGAHVHGNGTKQSGKAATCTEPGWKDYYKCSCDALFADAACTVLIPDLDAWKVGDGKTTKDHEHGSSWQSDATNHWNECACGDKANTAPHVDTNSDNECDVCGYNIPAEPPVHTHGSGTKQTGKAATCTEPGWKDYYKCSCDALFADAACTTPISDLDVWKAGDGKLAIDADAHSFGSTYTSSGDGRHYAVCAHNAEHKQYVNCSGGTATCTEKATCSVCGGQYGDLAAHSYTVEHGYRGSDGHANTCVCGAKDTVTAHTPGAAATESSAQTCTVCEYVITPMIGHVHTSHLTKVPANGATCTADGNTEYYTCSCGKWFTDNTAAIEITNHDSVKIPAAHTYGNLIAQKNPIHTAIELKAGMKAHYFCDVCDTYFTSEKVATTEDALIIAAPTHSYTVEHGYKGSDGHANTCACGAKDTVTAHTPDRAAASETDPVKCTLCGYVITPATGHVTCSDGIKQNGQSATCTTPGWKDYYKCPGCEKLYADAACTVLIPDLEAWKTGDGKTTKDHEHSSIWQSDATNHWNECTCGDKANTAPHTDANSDGECDVCAYGMPTQPPVHTHENGTKVDGQGASCTADGWKDYYKCSCNALFADAACTTPIADLEAWKTGDGKIAKTAHTHGTEWKSDASNHWHECTCGDKADSAAHSGGTATCETKAKCAVCGTEYGSLAEHKYGEVTCTQKAKCEVCGDEKGNLAEHKDSDNDGKCDACQYQMSTELPGVNRVEHSATGSVAEIPAGSTAKLPEGTILGVEVLSTSVISEATIVQIKTAAGESANVLAVYDLSLLLQGATLQPGGKLLVTLPAVTGSFTQIRVVYVAEDGSIEECKTTLNADGSISFETDHFSRYAIVGVSEVSEGKEGLPTGAIVGIIIGVVLLLAGGGFAVWWFIIRKKASPAPKAPEESFDAPTSEIETEEEDPEVIVETSEEALEEAPTEVPFEESTEKPTENSVEQTETKDSDQ